MKCSRTLWFLTIFMVGFPILYPVLSAFVFELGSKGILSIALSPIFYIGSALWIASGLGLQTLRHWAWYTFVGAQLLFFYFNALILVNYSESEFKGYTFIAVLTLQGFLFQLVGREVRVPYLFPKIKWWESGIAGMHHLDIALPSGARGQILDLSPRGCFVKTPVDFKIGEVISIRLDVGGQSGEFPGTIVWLAESKVTHPKGIGVQFHELDRSLRRKIRVITRSFNREKEATRGTPVLPS